MNRWRIGAAALAAVIIMTSCTPNVVPDGFQLLGRREVNFGIDRDAIEVNRAAGPLRQLLITAKMNPVEVFAIRVVFESGAAFDADVRERLFVGRDRLTLDLPGDARKVREVTFRYRKLNNAVRRAVVELWGR
jgi:hypothetical protein